MRTNSAASSSNVLSLTTSMSLTVRVYPFLQGFLLGTCAGLGPVPRRTIARHAGVGGGVRLE
jgi:hypothetical protein